LGIGDWGLGIGDWGLGPISNPPSPIPNPQSPIPNPQSPIPVIFKIINMINAKKLKKNIIYLIKKENKYKWLSK